MSSGARPVWRPAALAWLAVPEQRAKLRRQTALAVKRSIDLVLASTLAILSVPFMLVIATAIALDSPGPVLYRTKRIGRHGRHFPMLKFRTMVADAERRLSEIAHLNVATGMVKIPDDPRVTRVGKWLRRFSLDELPQLFNVLAGHMSLIGPRPHDVAEIVPHAPEHQQRLSMRPGLTGLWQVTARSDPRLETRIHCDVQYVHSWSLLLDAKILAKTVPAVVFARGSQVTQGITHEWQHGSSGPREFLPSDASAQAEG